MEQKKNGGDRTGLAARKEEGKGMGHKFAAHLTQEAAGLRLSDIAGADSEQEAQQERGKDIQEADHGDTRECEGRILPAKLTVESRAVEGVTQTRRRQGDVADFERYAEQLEDNRHGA